jgi:hypothetical protein
VGSKMIRPVRADEDGDMDTNKQAIHAELERVRQTFARHVAEMNRDDLRRRSNGTRWTNRQLLFHMLFGYMLVRNLLWMVKALGRLPRATTKPFAALLNFGTPLFHPINYLGSVGGGTVFTPQRMQRRLDRIIAKLEGDLDKQGEQDLQRGMYYPTKWDPYFKPYMQLADIYHYPTQHFDHHERQLSTG